ncbi:MAG: NUDIX domain-containing protein [Lachnospiraceae bacterium]|nr:NUDIX domain-containing protein [Lachnospiraceae bacterium]
MDEKLRNMTSIYITKGDEMLLLFRQCGRVVTDTWVGSAGGHFEENELNDPRACVLRELKEELGISESGIRNLLLRYVTLRRVKGEIQQNYYFFAELDNETGDHIVSTEGISRWFTFSELSALEMPYSAKYVIRHYLKIGRRTNDVYVGVADGERVDFTKLAEYE